jgi:hypothetical protein
MDCIIKMIGPITTLQVANGKLEKQRIKTLAEHDEPLIEQWRKDGLADDLKAITEKMANNNLAIGILMVYR